MTVQYCFDGPGMSGPVDLDSPAQGLANDACAARDGVHVSYCTP